MSALNKWYLRKMRRKVFSYLKASSTCFIRYAKWYVGVTSNPEVRKQQHERRLKQSVRYFKAWKMKSVKAALELEKRIGQKGAGCKGGQVKGNATKASVYLYVFKQ